MSSEHHGEVIWQRGGSGADFSANHYSRLHELRFGGGKVVVPGSASPHIVPAPWSSAAAVDPEAAFVASLAACHMLWFLDIAARAGWAVAAYRDDAVGTLGRDAEGRLAMTVVTLRPAVVFDGEQLPDRADIERLHHRAHDECFIARSVKTDVRCEPVLPG